MNSGENGLKLCRHCRTELKDEYVGGTGERSMGGGSVAAHDAISGQIRNLDLSCEPGFEIQHVQMGPEM